MASVEWQIFPSKKFEFSGNLLFLTVDRCGKITKILECYAISPLSAPGNYAERKVPCFE